MESELKNKGKLGKKRSTLTDKITQRPSEKGEYIAKYEHKNNCIKNRYL